MLIPFFILQLNLMPTICISAMDDKGRVTPAKTVVALPTECCTVNTDTLAPNTGNEPQEFIIPESDRQ